MSAVGDVGGWFRSATQTRSSSAVNAWGQGAGSFGLRSSDAELQAAAHRFAGRPTMVLTGAGMSTSSGLPDYRGRDAVARSPMLFQEFAGSDLSRRRYWARSTVGWRAFASAGPNSAHLALAQLAHRTPLTGIVTQNVDGLHQAAGSSSVVDLHGNLARVVCLSCGQVTARVDLQEELLRLNPAFADNLAALERDARSAPDGDAEVDRTDEFRYPCCPRCGGVLKPDVVFFGENAHRDVVARALTALEAAEVLLVLGSSLTVMSGLRFVRRAAKEGKDVIIVNDGATRGDELATLRIHGRLESVLERWVALLGDHERDIVGTNRP